jgi:homoserine kinase
MGSEQEGWIRVFAPATIGNVGPGFDVLGAAVEALGDELEARRCAQPGAHLLEVTGAAGLQVAADNTACVAAREVLARLGAPWGVELRLHKGLPVGSGLGSSGASAAAAATAVSLLADAPLGPNALLDACAEAERSACGAAHRDNVAPALLGGFVIVRADGSATRVHTPLRLHVALATPQRSLSTRRARQAIPGAIPLDEVVHNTAQVATLIYALAAGEVGLLREALHDRIAEPRRAPLIPGFAQAKQAALAAGALGASISGAGPTIFALCADGAAATSAAAAMSAALHAQGEPHAIRATRIAERGARRIEVQ